VWSMHDGRWAEESELAEGICFASPPNEKSVHVCQWKHGGFPGNTVSLAAPNHLRAPASASETKHFDRPRQHPITMQRVFLGHRLRCHTD